MMNREKNSFERGMTLVEMSIAFTVLAIMSIAIIQSLRSLSMSHNSMVSQSKVSSIGERVMSMIELDASGSMRMFAETPTSWNLFAKLDVTGRTPISGSRMPVATVGGTFEADLVGLPVTGNLLLMARRDGFELGVIPAGTKPKLMRVDMFRMVAWFLSTGEETGVDLNRWCSVKLARLQDIHAVVDLTERMALAANLYTSDVQFAWDPMEVDPEASFHAIASDGSITPLAASSRVSADPSETVENVFGKRFCGIATNGSVSLDVPKFARATSGFPHGFEIKRDGDGSGDLVLIRFVVATRGGSQRIVTLHESVRQIAFREE